MKKYRNNDVLLIGRYPVYYRKRKYPGGIFPYLQRSLRGKKTDHYFLRPASKGIETLEDRLRSRFEWGLTVDIQQPDYETRMAILRKKEELEGYNIDNEVIKYIASNVKSNIRELEGALTKIVALSKLNKQEITIRLAEEALKDLISPTRPGRSRRS